MDKLIYLIILLVGVGVGYFLGRKGGILGKGKNKSLIKQQAEEKKRNKEAIVGILETQTPLTNNHIEQLLGISDATATRYLEELEQERKIRQVGATGSHVFYEKVK